jgi:hypothetical protein
MSAIACPHCQSEMPGIGEFCADCGKALPIATSGPRIIGAREFATSATGQAVQSDELAKKVKSAFGILLAVAIIQLLFGIGWFVVGVVGLTNNPPPPNSSAVPPGVDHIITGVLLAIVGLVFLGIAIWARFMPLAAAITGLSLYGLFFALDIVASIAAGVPPGGVIIRILIMGALFKAVQAGLPHRELKRRLAAEGALAP